MRKIWKWLSEAAITNEAKHVRKVKIFFKVGIETMVCKYRKPQRGGENVMTAKTRTTNLNFLIEVQLNKLVTVMYRGV